MSAPYGWWAAAVAVGLVAGCGSGPAGRTATTLEAAVHSQAEYLPGLGADIYRPVAPAARTPVVVLLPGGAWRSADRSGLAPLAERLAADGMFVVNTTYRAADAGVRFPRPVQDIECAISFAVDRARRSGVEPGPVVALGHSSGAHLASLAALGAVPPAADCPYPSMLPDAFAGLAGVYDPMPFSDAVEPLIGASPADAPAMWRDANATTWAASRPAMPVFLAHGAADRLVPPSTSSAFADALRQGGHQVQLMDVRGAGHQEIYTPAAIAQPFETWLTSIS
jgi:acetyl esterase/lipase